MDFFYALHAFFWPEITEMLTDRMKQHAFCMLRKNVAKLNMNTTISASLAPKDDQNRKRT